MACNSCKKKSLPKVGKIVSDEKNLTIGKKIRNYFFNFLLFLILVIIGVPIAVFSVIYILFKSIVLEKKINIFPLMLYLGKKIVTKFEDEYEDDEDDDDEDDEDELDEEKYEYKLDNPYDVVELKDK